jgi:hypothetical protein
VANWIGAYQLDRRTVCGLGGALLVAPLMMEDGDTTNALKIHRNPLGWILGGCEGAVPLAPEALNDLRHLDTPVLCEDLEHAEEVERLLMLPVHPTPTLKVPMPVGMAA